MKDYDFYTKQSIKIKIFYIKGQIVLQNNVPILS